MSDATPARRRLPGLGRGLSALLGEAAPQPGQTGDGVHEVLLSHILADPEQPRRHFDEAALAELAESIRAHGVLQPIVVRRLDEGDHTAGRFRIIAGERRWRAAQRAGLRAMPAIIREFSDIQRLEVALIENIQREQLNAIEEGEAYRRLLTDHGFSTDDLSAQLGKSRSHIINLVRLNDLPDRVRAMVADGRLSMGHARTLVGHSDPERLAEHIVTKRLSVRAAETLAKHGKPKRRTTPRPHGAAPVDGDIALLERQLGDVLGVGVTIRQAGKQAGEAGSVTLSFASFDQLDMICQRLTGGAI